MVSGDRVLSALTRLVRRRPPRRLLTWIARTPVPSIAVERYAAAWPEPGLAEQTSSPLVCELPPGPVVDGPLAGAAVVVKDAIDVAGVATSSGLRDGGDRAARDAILVARLRAGGGRLIGKSKATELGMDGLGPLMPWPMPRNPRAPGYFPGGSSTGTAVAVASGLARYGVGSDGLGSIRIPAALCGLVGLKPSRAPWLADGYRTPIATLDVCGPMARTVEDCARLWQVLAELPVAPVAPRWPTTVGVVAELAPERACRAQQRAFTRALDAVGARVERLRAPVLAQAPFLAAIIGLRELATGPYTDRALSPAGALNLALGQALTDADAAVLAEARAAVVAAVDDVLARAPIVAMPTTAIPAPALSRGLLAGGQDLVLLHGLATYTPLANLCDLPAIAVPVGVDERGRPLSLMLMGRRGAELELLAAAAAIEATGVGGAPME